ncbi:MAG: multidrug ABC transporter ATP-binding protein, partial [Betaproteobacteria bacterium HGW-Betaproteobacteria-13]
RVLFLDEPTAGVDVELRRDMWALVSELRKQGVTVILTTHYIEEAEEMADRIGVITRGEIILVEDKSTLMHKLGRKQLTVQLQEAIDTIPETLAAYELERAADGHALVFTYDAERAQHGVAELLRDLATAGITFKDVNTTQSSLEDIFVDLVKEER